MTQEKPWREQSAGMSGRPDGRSGAQTPGDIERTRTWLEEGRKQAAKSPSPLWTMLLKAGEKTLAQMEAESRPEELSLEQIPSSKP